MSKEFDNWPADIHPANYVMKESPKAKAQTITPAEPLTIDATDVGAVRAMVWDKLVRIAAVAPPNASLLPILRELMDRIEGKPAQSVHLDATIKTVTVNATIKFADELPLIDNQFKSIDHNIE